MIDIKGLQAKRASVLGAKYRMWKCGGCGKIFYDGYVPLACECGEQGVVLFNAAVARNFLLDIAEELSDALEIIDRAIEREDTERNERGYLKTLRNDIEDCAYTALVMEDRYDHKDEYPVERILPD